MKRALVVSLLLLVSSFAAAVPLSTLVVPNAQTSSAGNGAGSDQIGGTTGNFVFQEVFGRGQFSSVSGGLLIQQIAFRAAPGTGPVSATDTSFSVYLSTSQFAPNTLGGNTLITTNYVTNEGPDNTLVLSGGPGTFFSSPGCTGPAPCNFDLVFNLTTPFLYNPQNGWLLMEVRFTGFNGVSGTLDSEVFNSPGGSVAQLDSQSQVDLSGPIVQFGYTPAPEPGSLVLLGTGLAGLASTIRRKKN